MWNALKTSLGLGRERRPPQQLGTQIPLVLCDELRLLHSDRYLECVPYATSLALRREYLKDNHQAESNVRASVGWDVKRAIMNVPGTLTYATTSLDRLWHWNKSEIGEHPHYAGMKLEVYQAVAISCELALKTLYAITHPEDPSKVYSNLGHDLHEIWDRLETEHDALLTVMGSMPLLPRAPIDQASMTEALWEFPKLNDLRYHESSEQRGDALHLQPVPIVRLGWAAYLRSCRLLGFGPDPSTDKSATFQRSGGGYETNDELLNAELGLPIASRQVQYGYPGAEIGATWRLIAVQRGLHGEIMYRCASGLVHQGSHYLFGSTMKILVGWVLGDRYPDYVRRYSGESDCRRAAAWGDIESLAYTLPGRLEVLTADYDAFDLFGAQSPEHLEVLDNDFSRPGSMIALATSAIFNCELALKMLYALRHPDASRQIHGHDVSKLWSQNKDSHAEILHYFQSMPLFINRHGDISADEVTSMFADLQMSGGSYTDLRYKLTRPEPKPVPVKLAFAPDMPLKVAWSAFLVALQKYERDR